MCSYDSFASTGRRYNVKATPMQKLQVLADQVIIQSKSKAEVTDIQLLVNGTAADLNLPLRFANLPSTAKLELRTGSEQISTMHTCYWMPKKSLAVVQPKLYCWMDKSNNHALPAGHPCIALWCIAKTMYKRTISSIVSCTQAREGFQSKGKI